MGELMGAMGAWWFGSEQINRRMAVLPAVTSRTEFAMRKSIYLILKRLRLSSNANNDYLGGNPCGANMLSNSRTTDKLWILVKPRTKLAVSFFKTVNHGSFVMSIGSFRIMPSPDTEFSNPSNRFEPVCSLSIMNAIDA